ncbi:MAG TPA: hypothetical protein VGG45_10225 [Terracidiphilus sp.]|jgi:hypothetical protein
MNDRHEHFLRKSHDARPGIIAAILLALLLFGTDTGRNALASMYLQSTGAIAYAVHAHAFPLDRFDPTCPQCM